MENSVTRAAKGLVLPFRAGALDVGSNAIRYVLAEFTNPPHFTELEGQRFPVRLGQDAFTSRVLSRATLDAAVATAARFRQRLDALGIVTYRAVATSAVRDSQNGGELVDRVLRESGIRLETVSGGEEARLVWIAVRQRIPMDEARWLLADLGGGSIELSTIDASGIRASETHDIGTVRLLANLGPGVHDVAEFRSLLERYVTRLKLPAGGAEVEGTIITGGNAEAIAELVGARPDAAGVREISAGELRALLDRLAGMTVAERIRDLGLREDRADVILPAAVVFDRVVELVGSDRILVPKVGVKDGLLYDLSEDFVEHGAHEGALDRLVATGALAMGRRYRFEESHAAHVCELALSLFDQLREAHGLGDSSRRLLSTAALLHDVGQFVSYRRHHKHSWYLIRNGDLPGLPEKDAEVAALVARYHRRSEPKNDHEGFRDLNEGRRDEVRKLAAILRVADALDREHSQHVRSVAVARKGDAVTLELETAGDARLELWALRKKASFFEDVFAAQLSIARNGE